MARAVVIGGGFSGLLCSKVLSHYFDEVLVLDRDYLADSSKRKGVPQASHLHVLLQKGRVLLEQIFSGIDAELASQGSPEVDWAGDTIWVGKYGPFPRFSSETKVRSCTRNLLESTIRKRALSENSKIDLAEKFEVTSFSQDDRTGKVSHVLNSDGNKIYGDFFVDASGQNSPFRKLMVCEKVDAYVGYASCFIRFKDPQALPCQQAYVQMNPPRYQRGGIMVPVENGIHWLTLTGAAKDYPSSEPAHFYEFARSLKNPIIHRLLSQAEIISPIRTFRRTSGVRIAKNDLQGRNFVSLGDALCSYNPVYGQGMTVATLSVMELWRQLAQGERISQEKISKPTQIPWIMAASEDVHVTEHSVEEMSLPRRVGLKVVSYLSDSLVREAAKSAAWHREFLKIIHMMEHPKNLIALSKFKKTA